MLLIMFSCRTHGRGPHSSDSYIYSLHQTVLSLWKPLLRFNSLSSSCQTITSWETWKVFVRFSCLWTGWRWEGVSNSRCVCVGPHLEDVVPGLHVRDVNPLAVNVVSVGIPAANCDSLCAKVCALVPFLDTCQTDWDGKSSKKSDYTVVPLMAASMRSLRVNLENTGQLSSRIEPRYCRFSTVGTSWHKPPSNRWLFGTWTQDFLVQHLNGPCWSATLLNLLQGLHACSGPPKHK